MHLAHGLDRLLSAAAVASAVLLGPVVAVDASCVVVDVEAWKSADVVMVGTVTGVDNNARWAKVVVEEIWRGPDQPPEVVIRGGPADPQMMTSTDRTFEVGVRYLFTVADVDGNLEDSSCSGTAEADLMDLERLRPADARVVTRPGAVAADGDLGRLAGPVLVVAIVGGLVLSTVLLARRREA